MLNLSRHWLFRHHDDPREFTRQKGGGAGTAVRAVRSFQRIKMTRGEKGKKERYSKNQNLVLKTYERNQKTQQQDPG